MHFGTTQWSCSPSFLTVHQRVSRRKIGDQIGKEARKRPEDQHEAWVAASWKMHVEGYAACGSLTKEVDKDIEKYARTFGQACGGPGGGATSSSTRPSIVSPGLGSGGGGGGGASVQSTTTHPGTPPRGSTSTGKYPSQRGNTVGKPKAGSLVPVVKIHIPCSASIVGTHIGLECN